MFSGLGYVRILRILLVTLDFNIFYQFIEILLFNYDGLNIKLY